MSSNGRKMSVIGMMTSERHFEIESLLEKGALDDAEKILLESEFDTPLSNRRKKQYLGQILFQKGNIQAALKEFIEAQSQFGQHISLLCDITSTLYQLNRRLDAEQSMELLEQELNSCWDSLSLYTLGQTVLCLGDFLENESYVSKARKLYYKGLQQLKDDYSWQIKILTRLVRLEARFFQLSGLNDLYSTLLYLSETQCNIENPIETQQTLIIAEIQLLGPNYAWNRLDNLLESTAISDGKKRQLVFNYLEEVLGSQKRAPQSFFNYLSSFTSQIIMTKTEEFLICMLDHDCDFDPSFLPMMSGQLTREQYLMLLCLCLNDHPNHVVELKNQFCMLLNGLPEDDQELWKIRLYQNSDEHEVDIIIDTLQGIIQSDQKQLVIPPVLHTLGRAFCDRKEVNMSEVCRVLWEETDDESIEKTFATIQTLNELIFRITAVDKAIVVLGPKAYLKHHIHLSLQRS